MSAGRESKFSEWTLAVSGGASDTWDAMRYLGKMALKVNEMQIRMINWAAERLGFVKKGGLLDSGEFTHAAAMLDCRSVTASGCARELLAEAHKKQPGEAEATLMGVLAEGSKGEKLAAAESLSMAGNKCAALRICGIMHGFERHGRARLACMAESLIRDGRGEADMHGICRALREGAARVKARGEDADGEFRKYLSRMRNAAKFSQACMEMRKGARRGKGPYRIRKRAASC